MFWISHTPVRRKSQSKGTQRQKFNLGHHITKQMGYEEASVRLTMAKTFYHKLQTENHTKKSESYDYLSANTYIFTYVTACHLSTLPISFVNVDASFSYC